MKLVAVSRELAEKHYAVHKTKPFYTSTLNYIISSPVIAIVLEGNNVIDMVRQMIGSTDPQKAEMGSIRGDLGQFIGKMLFITLIVPKLQILKSISGLNLKR